MCGDIYFTITCAATTETREDEKSRRPNHRKPEYHKRVLATLANLCIYS